MKSVAVILAVMLASCYPYPVTFPKELESESLLAFNRAESDFENGRYKDAIPSYELSLKWREYNMTAYKHLAICYEKMNNYKMAAKTLERSLPLTDRDEENLKNLIRLYYKVGRSEDAKKTQEWLDYVKSQSARK